jgi:hypothetical protein
VDRYSYACAGLILLLVESNPGRLSNEELSSAISSIHHFDECVQSLLRDINESRIFLQSDTYTICGCRDHELAVESHGRTKHNWYYLHVKDGDVPLCLLLRA